MEEKIIALLETKFNVPKTIIKEVLLLQKSVNLSFKEVLIKSKLISEDYYYQALADLYNKKYITSIETSKKINWTLYKMVKDNRILEDMISLGIFPAYIENGVLYITETEYDVYQEADGLMTKKDEKIEDIKSYLLSLGNNLKFNKIDSVLISDNTYRKLELTYKAPTVVELEEIFKSINFDKKIEETDSGNDVRLFLKALFVLAISRNASDIHIEPSIFNRHRISFRIMGDKETIISFDSTKITNVVNIIKQIAEMDINIHQKPQDGNIDGAKILSKFTLPIERIGYEKVEFNFDEVTFRISTYPVVPPMGGGKVDVSYESVVNRVLGADSTLASLDSLGISNQSKEELEFASMRNQGIILITGPTGSGKSTTLYAVLSSTDFLRKKLITYEDPVERYNPYWTQGQKNMTDNEKTNFGFEEASKAILRQDPDNILMGEIRDKESASFSIESANTGHLVLATLHTNSAADTVDRLKDLDIAPEKITSSLIAIFAQRLVKKVCPICSKKSKITSKEIEVLNKLEVNTDKFEDIELTFSNKEGCEYCNYTGYVGRVLIDEVIRIDRGIKELINKGAASYEIRDYANQKGFYTLLDNGMEKCQKQEIDFYDLVSLL